MPVVELTTNDECTQILTGGAVANLNQLVVLDFTATWCGPCRMIAPKLEELSNNLSFVKFYKIDVDTLPEITKLHGVSSMPTFQFFLNGKMLSTFSGCNYQKLVMTINQLLEENPSANLVSNHTDQEEEASTNVVTKTLPPQFPTL